MPCTSSRSRNSWIGFSVALVLGCSGSGGATMFLRLLLVSCLVVAVSAQTTDADRDALFAAIRRGAAGDVERVLARGASPNARDAEGIPALMAAALFADADIVELLLKRGADP